jgi:indoleamine 2,3-dioxygenase
MAALRYILRCTLHPVATGGSPIVTWLPNQLSVVLKAMEDVVPRIQGDQLKDPADRVRYEEIRKFVTSQRKFLSREVEKYKTERHCCQ